MNLLEKGIRVHFSNVSDGVARPFSVIQYPSEGGPIKKRSKAEPVLQRFPATALVVAKYRDDNWLSRKQEPTFARALAKSHDI